MHRTTSVGQEQAHVPSMKFVALYTVLVLVLMVINLAGYGLIALTA
jgi:uncharacterized membrane protein